MISWYYFCDIEVEQGNRNLDDYEEEYDYQAIWASLQEAIAANEKVQQREAVPWIMRENEVMRQMLHDGV